MILSKTTAQTHYKNLYSLLVPAIYTLFHSFHICRLFTGNFQRYLYSLKSSHALKYGGLVNMSRTGISVQCCKQTINIYKVNKLTFQNRLGKPSSIFHVLRSGPVIFDDNGELDVLYLRVSKLLHQTSYQLMFQLVFKKTPPRNK